MNIAHIRDYKNKLIHLIGIGGSSMSGLAEMLQSLGYSVQGSDGAESYIVDMLRKKGICVTVGHSASNILGVGLVVYSAAIDKNNPERVEAKKLNIPQIERKDLLGQLMEEYKNSICICGTHGKTTTSGMLAHCLAYCGKDPSVHIGGRLDSIGGSVRMGGHEYFVAEACEFNESFLSMPANIALLMNISEDHLDYYRDINHIKDSFTCFLKKLEPNGLCIYCADDKNSLDVVNRLNCKKIGFAMNESANADYLIKNLKFLESGNADFDIYHKGKNISHITLSVPGKIQALDALAVFACCDYLNIENKDIQKALNSFTGVHRRFELTGVYEGVKYYHDYGHNPEEMEQILHTAKMQNPKRLIAVMQPHTFSRVKRLFNSYGLCTKIADISLVTDICAAREWDDLGMHSSQIVKLMKDNGINAHYTPSFDDVQNYLLNNCKEGDLVITMGCGDINKLNDNIKRYYEQKD